METFKMLKVAVWEQALGTAQVSEWICIASGVNCAENAESLGCPVTAKQIKVWNEWKNLFPEAEESLSLKLLACWEFNLGQKRAFWTCY